MRPDLHRLNFPTKAQRISAAVPKIGTTADAPAAGACISLHHFELMHRCSLALGAVSPTHGTMVTLNPRRPDAGRLARAVCSHIGDSPSRCLLQENGGTRRRSRLKIQAGCRPHRHTLPDPNAADPLRSATAGRLVSNGVGIFCIKRNVPNRVTKSDATDHRTPDLDAVL